MVLLRILAGDAAGREVRVRRFPFTAGRSPRVDLQLSLPGVWDEHFQLERDPRQGLRLSALDRATTRLNGHQVTAAPLRNGDIIEAGSARVQFWLAATEQASLNWRERMTWAGLAALLAAQILLVWRLPV